MARVAIGLPVYNGGKYLRECLDSILRQTFREWVCVINNNCSTDDTEAIALEYVQKDARIHYRRSDTFLTAVESFNKAFEVTVSFGCEYFKCAPADDWIYENYLEETVNLLDRYPSAGLCSSYRIDGTQITCDGLDIYKGPLFDGRQRLIEEMTSGPRVTGSLNTVIYRVTTLGKLTRFPVIYERGNIHCDTELARDVLGIADMAFIFKVLSYTRRHDESVSSMVNRMNTAYSNQYNSLLKRKEVYPELQPHFDGFRKFYAWFMIKLVLTRRGEARRWHLAEMKKKLTLGDYFAGALMHGPITRSLMRWIR